MEKKGSLARKILGIIGIVLFFLSFIPYTYLIAVATEGVSAGLLGGPQIYGWEAVCNILLWGTIIPVYPVCFIYEVVFAIVYIRKKGMALKIIALAVTASVVIGIIIPCVVFEYKKSRLIADYESEIKTYLDDKYGTGFSNDISVSVLEYDRPLFGISAPALPDGCTFEYSPANEYFDGHDSLVNEFIAHNAGFTEAFNDYIEERYSLQDNMEIDAHIDSFDLSDFNDGDDYTSLFDTVEYRVSSITVTCDEIDDDSLMELLNQIDADYIPAFNGHMFDYLMVYVFGDNTREYYVQITPRSPQNGQPDVANIEMYTDSTVYSELDGTQVFLNATVIEIA
jgi:hypothetical protein